MYIDLIPQDAVIARDGQAVTSSLTVAEVFGKEHKNVMRDIKSLEIPEKWRGLNFELTQHLVQAGSAKRNMPYYRLTRDGFTLLVMGFTGKKAMQFKLAYIHAFNQMEGRLQNKAFNLHEHDDIRREVIRMVVHAKPWKLVELFCVAKTKAIREGAYEAWKAEERSDQIEKNPKPAFPSADEIKHLTVPGLRKLARQRGLAKGGVVASARKEDLIRLLTGKEKSLPFRMS